MKLEEALKTGKRFRPKDTGPWFEPEVGLGRSLFSKTNIVDQDWEVEETPRDAPIHITEDDVGRKVRLRNGAVAIITGIHWEREYPVSTPFSCHKIDGTIGNHGPYGSDIMEFVETESVDFTYSVSSPS